jgi:hypothetical protein
MTDLVEPVPDRHHTAAAALTTGDGERALKF